MEFFPDNTTFLVLGPLVLRWYALAYIGGLVVGWRWLRVLAQKAPAVATPLQADEFLTWATVGVVLGGRLGYVLFYQPVRFLADPVEIFAVWHGGMSFHGGMLGVAVAVVIYCRRQNGRASRPERPASMRRSRKIRRGSSFLRSDENLDLLPSLPARPARRYRSRVMDDNL